MTRQECLHILELSPNATSDDVTKAYRQLIQVWHPDRFPGNPDLQRRAEDKLKRINEAYAILSEASLSPQSPQQQPVSVYTDDEVQYLGGDPRLNPSECIVTVGVSALSITVPGREAVLYRHASFFFAESSRYRWVQQSGRNAATQSLRRTDIRFCVEDKERVRDSISVNLRFRNDYFADLFLKKLCERGLYKYTRKETAVPDVLAYFIIAVALSTVFGGCIWAVSR